jgi:thiamine transport system substrate-binding protein
MSCLALTGCLASAGLRDLMVNPKNLIRFVPAEGLDVHHAPIPVFQPRRREHAQTSRVFCCCLGSILPFTAQPAIGADRSLTIYTYDSFVAEWGPGPQDRSCL